MKVSELTGGELDFWVANAEGKENVELQVAQRSTNKICVVRADGGRQFDYAYSPSSQWSVGGPIIEREKISLACSQDGKTWYALIPAKTDMSGPTALISAMRAYVASKFGDEVEDN